MVSLLYVRSYVEGPNAFHEQERRVTTRARSPCSPRVPSIRAGCGQSREAGTGRVLP